MILFGLSLWGDALLLIAGALGAFLIVGIWDWTRLRFLQTRRLQLLKEIEVEIEFSKTEAQLAAKLDADRIRETVEVRLESKEKTVMEREEQALKREGILNQQLESLSTRESALGRQREDLDSKQKELNLNLEEASSLGAKWAEKLSLLAGLSATEARSEVLEVAEAASLGEARDLSRRILEKAKLESEESARRIIGLAIQRYAGDHTSDTTTAAVALKGDDIKGRIIGREGRNIRAFENATGMTVLIDDTPNAVVLSGFDPVRREVARESMERLIADGRIHPTRIEEVVDRVKSEIDDRIVKLAEEAVGKLGLSPFHGEIAKRLGRLYFRLSYSQNVLDHSVEVARLTALMAAELGANVTDATRSGLLHDIGKALGDEMKGSHASVGADFIRRHGENAVVVNAVASHHDEVEHETVLGMLVSAADAISAARPGARSEPITSFIDRLKNLEEVGMSFDGVERCFAIQAGREVRVFVRPESVSDESAYLLAKDVCRKIEDELQYPGQIRVTVIREIRCVDYAK
jgi:ribonuclease Y